MKKSLLGFGLIAFVIIAAGPLWAGGVLSSISHRDKFYDIEPWGESLWITGFPGNILSLEKKTETWKRHEKLTQDPYFALGAFDDKTAVMTSPKGAIWRTTDKGKSWKKIEPITENILFNVTTLYNRPRPERGKTVPESGAIENEKGEVALEVLQEEKEGEASEKKDLPPLSEDERAKLGWAVGHFNTILHTKDAGETWTKQTYTIPEDEVDEPGLNDVEFVDEYTGWIVGEFGYILHTEDGGETWIKQKSPTSAPLYALEFLDYQTGVAVGADGSILVTRNGGKQWTRRETGMQRHFFDLDVIGKMIHAVGQDGYHAYGSLTKEAPFENHRTGIYSWLGSVYFLDEKNGFAAGGRGSILKTTDGGQSWQAL